MKKKCTNEKYTNEKNIYKLKVHEWKKGMRMKKREQMKSIRITKWKYLEWKTAFEFFLTKPNGKYTQLSNKVVLSDSKWT